MSLPDDLKARLRLNDTSLWILTQHDDRGVSKAHCLAEADEQGGLTYLCDMTNDEWWSTPGTRHPGKASQDISVTDLQHYKLRWVKAPPWLDM